jgi:hypothetical protein
MRSRRCEDVFDTFRAYLKLHSRSLKACLGLDLRDLKVLLILKKPV